MFLRLAIYTLRLGRDIFASLYRVIICAGNGVLLVQHQAITRTMDKHVVNWINIQVFSMKRASENVGYKTSTIWFRHKKTLKATSRKTNGVV